MKIYPEIANVINILTKDKDDQYQKKLQDEQYHDSVADIVSVENKQASRPRVENVEEAKAILTQVTENMENVSLDLYTLNLQRISNLIS
jgi:hypothetical protein